VEGVKNFFVKSPFGNQAAWIVVAGLLFVTTALAKNTNELADPLAAETTPASAKLRWMQLSDGNLEINGLPWFKENEGSLSRLPVRLKSTYRKAVWNLAQCPSGGRIRFRT